MPPDQQIDFGHVRDTLQQVLEPDLADESGYADEQDGLGVAYVLVRRKCAAQIVEEGNEAEGVRRRVVLGSDDFRCEPVERVVGFVRDARTAVARRLPW